MEAKLNTFCRLLESLEPKLSHVPDLYDLLEPIREATDIRPTYDSIFRFIERYPDADLGNPGPLIHFIEKSYPDYVPHLLASLNTYPTYYSVMLLHRILHLDLPTPERQSYLSILKQLSKSETINQDASAIAREFYDFHLAN